MIANTALLAAVTTFLLVAWLAGELVYLVPFKRAIFWAYGWHLGGLALVLFVNLSGWFYLIARWMFLRDAGRKLRHMDRQLETPESVHAELREHLQARRR
ncbi:MAG: hypothetical protein R2745_02095 [Vicinamibacterales bacterium]